MVRCNTNISIDSPYTYETVYAHTLLSNYFGKFVRMRVAENHFQFSYTISGIVRYLYYINTVWNPVHNCTYILYIHIYVYVYINDKAEFLFVCFLPLRVFFQLLFYVAELNFLLFLLPLFCDVGVCVLYFVRELRFLLYELFVYVYLRIWKNYIAYSQHIKG